MVPFALYVCAMEKMPSGNADTAFVIVIMIIISYMAHIIKVLCIVPMYKSATYSIMELMLLWIPKRLLKNGIIVTIYLYPTEAIHQRNKVCCIAVITV